MRPSRSRSREERRKVDAKESSSIVEEAGGLEALLERAAERNRQHVREETRQLLTEFLAKSEAKSKAMVQELGKELRQEMKTEIKKLRDETTTPPHPGATANAHNRRSVSAGPQAKFKPKEVYVQGFYDFETGKGALAAKEVDEWVDKLLAGIPQKLKDEFDVDRRYTLSRRVTFIAKNGGDVCWDLRKALQHPRQRLQGWWQRLESARARCSRCSRSTGTLLESSFCAKEVRC